MRTRNIAKEERSRCAVITTSNIWVDPESCWKIVIYLLLIFIMSFILFIHWCRLVSDALKKMKGKIPEIASSHVSSRVLQVLSSLFFLLMTRIYDAPNGFANSFLLILDLCETLYTRWKECCVCGDSTSFYHSCQQYLCSSSGDKDAWKW